MPTPLSAQYRSARQFQFTQNETRGGEMSLFDHSGEITA